MKNIKRYESVFTEARKDEEITVIIFDKKKIRWEIEIERTWRNGYMEFTMSGKGKGSVGQNLDRVVPVDINQKRLINFWKIYHLKEINDKIWKEILKVVDILKEKERIRREAETVSWEDIDDDKIVALAQHLDMTAEEAMDTISEERGDCSYSVGRTDYLVCDDNEADRLTEEYIENLIDDIGISAFNGWENYVKSDWFEDALREMEESYAYEIENERDRTYGNRLIQEMYDAGIIDDDDFEQDEDGDPIYDEFTGNIDSARDEYIDYLVDRDGDPVEYYKDNFGDDAFNNVVTKNNLVAIDAFIIYAISVDGRGHFLNRYDGVEYEENVGRETYYIYEQ